VELGVQRGPAQNSGWPSWHRVPEVQSFWSGICGVCGGKLQRCGATGLTWRSGSRKYVNQPRYISTSHVPRREPFVVANRLRNLGMAAIRHELLDRMTDWKKRLSRESESAELFMSGQGEILNFMMPRRHPLFERALALDPQSTQIKLAYADANFKRDEYEKISSRESCRRYRLRGVRAQGPLERPGRDTSGDSGGICRGGVAH